MPRRMIFDRWIFLTAALLVVVGIFMVGSASHYVATSQSKSSYYFLLRHGIHLSLGVAAFLAALHIPYRTFSERRLIVLLSAASILALIAVLAMPAAGGAHRWFRMGPFTVQPSEFAKIVAILFMAYLLTKREQQVNDPWAVPLPCLAVIGSMTFLVAIEPDLGSAVMLAATAGFMVFVAGLRWAYIVGVLGLSALGFLAAVLSEPYRMQRIQTFLNPTVDTQGAGFQLTQSLIAIGNGGLTGVGFGQGQQQAFYLPAAHTDFIFAVVGEEMGFLGTMALLTAFLLVFWRGIRAALHAPDRFGFYLSLGATSLLVLQGLTHIGVCVGLLPTKGLPLPFMSYGGSSLLATLALTGLLLNVSQHSN